MEKIGKRLISLIMVFTLCMPLFPQNASAVNAECNIGDAVSITNESHAVRTKEVAADLTNVTINGTFCQTSARSMLDMINDFRTGSEAWAWNESDTEKIYYTDLGTLSYDYDLERIAMQRAAEIALSFSHTRPNGQSCWTAYNEKNYGYQSAGENLAAGYSSAADVFEGWKETDEAYSGQGHRRNMLSSNRTAVGIAGFYYDGCYYWVQEFAYPTASSSYTPANDSAANMNVSIPTDTTMALSADKTSLEVKKGAEVNLPAISAKITLTNCWPSRDCTVIPTDITWSSANPSIASISGSKVTGVANGKTTLTAKNKNGNTVTCAVTVTSSTVAVTGITLNKTNLSLEKGDSATLTATVTPTNATDKSVTWTSSNTNAATVSGGNVTAVGVGSATITAKTGNGKTATCKVTVTNPTSTSKFTDVPNGVWYEPAVQWAVSNGITAGTSETTFSPNQSCTRSQVATFLWSASGKPEPKTTQNPFTDVKTDSWYYKAVLWAYENNITAGTSATTFSPNATCTRAQIATFLWSAEGKPKPKTTKSPFTDVKKGDWYYDPILWFAENKITAGTSPNTYSPNEVCTRAQIVTFLYLVDKL